MKKSVFVISLVAAMLTTSCVSKKELVACQEQNKALQTNIQETKDQLGSTKEQLAASTARVSSLEQQLQGLSKTNSQLQKSLDKSLSNSSQNNISIEKVAVKRIVDGQLMIEANGKQFNAQGVQF